MSGVLARRAAVGAFLAFAFAYFLSAVLRAITATLAPALSEEFALEAADLGLLAGGYFLGFAITQLPLGAWLDRHGPKKVALSFLGVAVLGCLVFSVSRHFSALLAGRVLCGAGVSACLMAPLTGYRRWFGVHSQVRVNAWMMMTGSLGMVAATLPVQWLLPLWGWRPVFWALSVLIAVAMVVIALVVPRWNVGASLAEPVGDPVARAAPARSGYALIARDAYFQRLVPLGFFAYGGMVAMQTLWAGPWMRQVAGYTPLEAAAGLFWINVCMLLAFWGWGACSPALARKGWGADRLMAAGLPLSLLALAAIVVGGSQAGALAWAVFCVSSTFVCLSQPAVALAFAPHLAGRVLSAFNLVIFVGVFAVQWGVGLAVDALITRGAQPANAYRLAIALYLACNAGAYAWFLLQGRRHNRLQISAP